MTPNAPQKPTKSAVTRQGRRMAGAGKRAAAPTPFLHSHPANARAAENFGRPNAPRAT